jgi:hypothetical protein
LVEGEGHAVLLHQPARLLQRAGRLAETGPDSALVLPMRISVAVTPGACCAGAIRGMASVPAPATSRLRRLVVMAFPFSILD